ncbi:YifB family Mg chelatase-like AAA ATPase [Alkalihalobacillus sp. 1P02AB]|uniref:YifB family Mg chelatase-like AAA ATPase n=1 Tax=Alkalihalobacillus sp. 1P02AB TaxID=3132260 RepID=UPI0039A431F2
MTANVFSIGLKGLEGYRVQVEVQVFRGTESMVIVGLPDASVKESKERVLSAIRTLECNVSTEKIVVNLSPSEQKKNGPLFDLAMAIAVLKEKKQIQNEIPQETAFIGTLSLDGSVVKVEGMLPAVIAAKSLGFKSVFLPYDPLIPIEMLEGIECFIVQHINDVLLHLSGQVSIPISTQSVSLEESTSPVEFERDFSDIIGQEKAKQALEVAAAGGHNMLISGPPGCGKSMLAEAFPSIFPRLSKQAQLEKISLYQLAKEKLKSSQLPPYRHPHHSASSVAIIGGGQNPKPGEISLAHHGILFLDEMGEFTKKTLDMLRQPLETGKVTISRAHSTVTYPSSFLLIGAMNPCPCGYLGSNTHYCSCTAKQIRAYHNRVSGPIYDRIDILLSLHPVDLEQTQEARESSVEIQKRVEQARERQYVRYQAEVTNARVPFKQLMETSPLPSSQQKMLTQISSKQQWSNRVQIKMIRLARTLSDLVGEESISDESLWKAMALRRSHFSKEQMKVRRN